MTQFTWKCILGCPWCSLGTSPLRAIRLDLANGSGRRGFRSTQIWPDLNFSNPNPTWTKFRSSRIQAEFDLTRIFQTWTQPEFLFITKWTVKLRVTQVDLNLTWPKPEPEPELKFSEPKPDLNWNSGHTGRSKFDPNPNFPNPYLKIRFEFGFGSIGHANFARSTCGPMVVTLHIQGAAQRMYSRVLGWPKNL